MRLSLADSWGGNPEPGTPVIWNSDHADGLVAMWPGWDGSTSQIEEIVCGNHVSASTTSGNVQLALVPGDVWPVPSYGSSAASNPLSYPTSSVFNLPAFTFSCRANILVQSSNNYKGLFSCRTSGNAGFQVVSEATSSTTYQPHLVATNAAGSEVANKKTSASFTLPFDAFRTMVWTWDGTTARLWMDGIEYAVVSSADAGFGASGNRFFFATQSIFVQAYDFRVYNRARPELGTQLHDPSTRWNIFSSPRVRIASQGTGGVAMPVIGCSFIRGMDAEPGTPVGCGFIRGLGAVA